MGYAETRLRQDVQRLKRDIVTAQAREARTREGALGLARALQELVNGAVASGAPALALASELLQQAGVLLAPDPTEG